MPAKEEVEGIVDLGRGIADDALRLVRAEIDLAKAQAKETALWLGAGIGLIFASMMALLFYVMFALGTVNEGTSFSDNWAFFAAFAALILAPILFLLFGKIHWIVGAVIAVLPPIGLTAWFYISILISDEARKGWAISAIVFFLLVLACAGLGALLLIRAKNRGLGLKDSLMEDAAWAKGLTKRNANEN